MSRATACDRPRAFRQPVAALLAAATSLCLCATIAVAQEGRSARLLVTHAGLEAYLDNADCGSTGLAKLRVLAAETGAFVEPRLDLQRLVGGARAALQLECPRLSRITVAGVVGGRLCFAGASARSDRWKLIGLYADP